MDADSLILFLFFLLCSAYCASAETAYTAVSRVRLRTMVDKGNKKAKKALWICDRFDKTLTTVLIGNSSTKRIGGHMVTPRGYARERKTTSF